MALDTLLVPEDRLRTFAHLLARAKKIEQATSSQKDFLTFVKAVWPEFVQGRHHIIMAEKFNRIADGSLKRLIVNMPPRHTKASLPAICFLHG